MKHRKLGKTGLTVFPLGFGCMRLPTLKPGEPAIDHEKAINLIRKGIDSGINYIDTAYPYHGKESEIVVGLALKNGYREKEYLFRHNEAPATRGVPHIDFPPNQSLLQRSHVPLIILPANLLRRQVLKCYCLLVSTE